MLLQPKEGPRNCNNNGGIGRSPHSILCLYYHCPDVHCRREKNECTAHNSNFTFISSHNKEFIKPFSSRLSRASGCKLNYPIPEWMNILRRFIGVSNGKHNRFPFITVAVSRSGWLINEDSQPLIVHHLEAFCTFGAKCYHKHVLIFSSKF